MDTFISIIIAGMGVAYIVELIASVSESYFNPRTIKLVLTLPLSYAACWFLDLTEFTLAVGGPAAAFFSLGALHLLNRPVSIQPINRR
jgi:hypothetical protein